MEAPSAREAKGRCQRKRGGGGGELEGGLSCGSARVSCARAGTEGRQMG